MSRAVGVGCVLAAMVLYPSAAFADEKEAGPPAAAADPAATVDTIHLRNGEILRGRVAEIATGDHVSVLLPSGETRRITWSDVDRVVVASTDVPRPPAAAPPPMVGPLVRVHLKSSKRSTLYRRAAGTADFVTACNSPCDMDLPLGDTYQIGGSGIGTTKEFRLQGSPGGAVELAVDGPNWFGIVGGGVLTLTGVSAVYAGLLVAASNGKCDECRGGEDERNVALGVAAVGAALIGLGLVIVFPSMKTDLSQQTGAPPRDAYVRAPVWRSASAVETSSARPTFPLFFEQRF